MDEIIKNRKALEGLFGEGIIPSANDFKSLIDSVVVKQDDKFFGKWKSGAGYTEGDVVLYEDEMTHNIGIYVFISKSRAKALDPQCNADDDCGNKNPNQCCRWQLLHLDIDDGDWVIDEAHHTMYAKVYGKMGIGTTEPKAFLHLNDKRHSGSQFIFNPLGHKDSAVRFQMVNEGVNMSLPENQHFEQKLDTQWAQWLTNTPLGFVFKKQLSKPKIEEQSRDMEDENKHHDRTPVQKVLLLVMNNEGNHPRIGIGTDSPKAALEVLNTEGGNTIQLDVDNDNKPQFVLLKETEEKTYEVVQSLENESVVWSTDALNGYVFTHKDDSSVLSFQANGNVGIGTLKPSSKLEIVDNDERKGKFTFEVDDSIPLMEITNILEENEEVKMSVAVHHDSAVFSTDAAQGFAFMHQDFHEPMLSILPEGEQSQLILQGYSNSKGVYVRPLVNDNKNQVFTEGLKILRTLTPLIRKPEGDNHTQLGFAFKSKDAKSQLPSEVLRQFPNQNFGIAQHNLVAMLVAAVKELEDKVNKLEGRVKDLERHRNV